MKNSIFVLFIALIIFNGATAEEEERKPKLRPCEQCLVAYRCSSEKNPVWATDGKSCFTFLNNCYFLSENCNRRRQGRCDKLLKKTTKERCQRLCKPICTADYSPLCGYQGETDKRTFSNQCAMTSFNCLNTQFYQLFAAGECP